MPPKNQLKLRGKQLAAKRHSTSSSVENVGNIAPGSNVASILKLPENLPSITPQRHMQGSTRNIVVDNRRPPTAHTHKILRARDPLKAPSGSAETLETLLLPDMMVFEQGYSSSSADQEDGLSQPPTIHISSNRVDSRRILRVTAANTNAEDSPDLPQIIQYPCQWSAEINQFIRNKKVYYRLRRAVSQRSNNLFSLADTEM